MAIFHLTCKVYSRSKDHSAVAGAAYRAGVHLVDERTKKVHGYSRKAGVLGSELILPPNAPTWARDRGTLWNAAEKAEVRKNASVGREFEVSLPAELPDANRRTLGRQFTQELVNTYGFAAEISFHAPAADGDGRNFHAHILCSTRVLGPDGFGEKTRVLDDRITGPKEVTRQRNRWAEIQNEHLKEYGEKTLVDARSLKDQGLTREPSRHLGKAFTHRERRLEMELEGVNGFRAWNSKFDSSDDPGERTHEFTLRSAIAALERREGIERTLRAEVERLHLRFKELKYQKHIELDCMWAENQKLQRTVEFEHNRAEAYDRHKAELQRNLTAMQDHTFDLDMTADRWAFRVRETAKRMGLIGLGLERGWDREEERIKQGLESEKDHELENEHEHEWSITTNERHFCTTK